VLPRVVLENRLFLFPRYSLPVVFDEEFQCPRDLPVGENDILYRPPVTQGVFHEVDEDIPEKRVCKYLQPLCPETQGNVSCPPPRGRLPATLPGP